jgi:hypothetical protein
MSDPKLPVVVKPKEPSFQVDIRPVKNTHDVQLFVDAGMSPGPWVRVGFNDTSYAAGWLPKQRKR